MANVDDISYSVPYLTGNDTFLDWINHYNTNIVNKLNNLKIFDGASGDGIVFTLGTDATNDPAGGATSGPDLASGIFRCSLAEVIPNGITFSGDVSIDGTLNYDLSTLELSSIKTRVHPMGGFTATSGFTFGMPARIATNSDYGTEGDYFLSKANSKEFSEVFGVVSGVTWPVSSGTPQGPYTSSNTYIEVTTHGKIKGDFSRALASESEFGGPPSRGLSAGCTYFLSPGNSGGITRVEPTIGGQVSKPVLTGLTSDVGYILHYRGQFLQASGTGGTGGIDNNRFYVEVPTGSSIALGDVVGYDPDLGAGGNAGWFTAVEGTRYENIVGLCITAPFVLDSTTYIQVIASGYFDNVNFSSYNHDPGTGVLYVGTDGKLTSILPANPKPVAIGWRDSGSTQIRANIINQNHNVSNGVPLGGGGGNGNQKSGRSNESWAYVSTSKGGATYGSAINENILINGGFDVWQRGIGINGPQGGTGSTYFADKWVRVDGVSASGGGATTGIYSIERKSFTNNQVDVYGNPKYYASLRNDCLPDASKGDYVFIENRVEDVRVLRGEDATISFFAKCGVTGSTMDIVIDQYDGTNVKITKPASVSVGTLWGKYEISFFVPEVKAAPTGKHYVGFGFDTSRLNTTLDLAQIKVERGMVATKFADVDEELELNKCRRYYQRSYDIDEQNATKTMIDDRTPSITAIDFTMSPSSDHFEKFKVKMRGNPTVTMYSPGTGYTGDAYNRTLGKDTRNSSGTFGKDGAVRQGLVGRTCITTVYARPHGIFVNIPCGAVLWDDISFHYVADADLDENMPNKGV